MSGSRGAEAFWSVVIGAGVIVATATTLGLAHSFAHASLGEKTPVVVTMEGARAAARAHKAASTTSSASIDTDSAGTPSGTSAGPNTSTAPTDDATEPRTTEPVVDPTPPPAATNGATKGEASVRVFENATSEADLPEDGFDYLTLGRAYELWQEGVIFLDARHDYQFEAGRIPYSFWLPSSRISSGHGDEVMQFLPPQGPIVVYCDGGEECDASKNTVMLLVQAGYENVSIFYDGYNGWVAADLDIESGPVQEGP